jgi:hypothetical protein
LLTTDLIRKYFLFVKCLLTFVVSHSFSLNSITMCAPSEKTCAVGTASETPTCREPPRDAPRDIERDPKVVEYDVPVEETTQTARSHGMIHNIRAKIPFPKPTFSVFTSGLVGGLLAAVMVLTVVSLSILIVTLTNGKYSIDAIE